MDKNRSLLIFVFRILPTGVLSRIFGRIARIPLPDVVFNPVIRWYCARFQVKTDEIPAGARYRTLDAFFTRTLKAGTHRIDKGRDAVVSPVDAQIGQYGKIAADTLLQAKGVEYGLSDFLPSEFHRNFINGSFITFYLAPGDYHRIHSPVKGRVIGWHAVPGRLNTVQEFMVRGLKGLFTKNERVFSYLKSDCGLVAVCKVGAMNVGRITLSYCDVETNRTFRRRGEFFYPGNTGPAVARGGELGTFHMGSTVVVLFQRGAVKLDRLEMCSKVRVGQRIGRTAAR